MAGGIEWEAIKPVPMDDNEIPLVDRGSDVFTYRFSGVTNAISGIPNLDLDYKSIMIHVESGSDVLYVSGGVTGSTTAILTDAGISFQFPIVHISGSGTPFGIGVNSGASGFVSVIAWR